jgi:hypothetical protein
MHTFYMCTNYYFLERTSEEIPSEVGFPHAPSRLEQQSSSQLTMSADLSERSGSLREQTSTDSDIQNCSQDSGGTVPHSMVCILQDGP